MESGLNRGVFYGPSGIAEVWNGLISVIENEDDSAQIIYVDGLKKKQKRRRGYFTGTIQSVSYPSAFMNDVLAQRKVPYFGMSYRTIDGESYKIHILYNILPEPSTHIHSQGTLDLYSWNFSSIPVAVPTAMPSTHMIIESSIAYSWTLAALESVLYGSDETDAKLPTPTEIYQIFEDNSILQIIDNGDGSWTAIGPDEVIQMLDATTFQITWPSAVYISADTYTIHSL